MARITVEDCLKDVENRYELVHLVTKRVKQLKDGAEPLVRTKNKEIVNALREISAGLVIHSETEEYDSDEF
jgi:DNA-directed RNA polymerase subunit omega